MSRLTGMFITLVYFLGASILGYYGHAARALYEAQGAEADWLLFYVNTPYITLGIFAMMLAIALHAVTISVANQLDRGHVSTEEKLQARIDELQDQLDEKNAKMSWVENAIERAIRNPVTREEKEARKLLLLEDKEESA